MFRFSKGCYMHKLKNKFCSKQALHFLWLMLSVLNIGIVEYENYKDQCVKFSGSCNACRNRK